MMGSSELRKGINLLLACFGFGIVAALASIFGIVANRVLLLIQLILLTIACGYLRHYEGGFDIVYKISIGAIVLLVVAIIIPIVSIIGLGVAIVLMIFAGLAIIAAFIYAVYVIGRFIDSGLVQIGGSILYALYLLTGALPLIATVLGVIANAVVLFGLYNYIKTM